MVKHIRQLKRELVGAIISLAITVLALTSTTYAWYVANNKVDATTSTISATTNGFILQIATLKEGVQHGGEQKSLEALTTGATLSPSSTDNLKDWYVCAGWDDKGLVTGYSTPVFETGADVKPGNYKVSGDDYYAYIRSDYIVYTITDTGTADVYLDASEGVPITVTPKTTNAGSTGAETVTGSMRVAITTQPLGKDGKTPTGTEELRLVYAVNDETGKGNDSMAMDGWTSIQNNAGTPVLGKVTYPYIYGGHYTDQLTASSKNWVATKNGDNFIIPDNSEPIAKGVGYDGIVVHVYIWMEGTDADCVNGKSIEDDPTTYDVTVKLAGVATGENK